MALHFLTADAGSADVGEVVALAGPEAKHAAVVRRVRTGEVVTLGDGAGTWLEGEVLAVAPAQVDIRVTARTVHLPPAQRIVLAQALAKGDRDELAVQAACELGVDQIVPWQAERSISRWQGAKAIKGRERWESIVREAAKQSHRPWIPSVASPSTTAQLIERATREQVLVLEPTATERLAAQIVPGRDILLVVGPEGGISAQEQEAFTQAGAVCVRLGASVLRTSTAGPAALAALSVLLGRW